MQRHRILWSLLLFIWLSVHRLFHLWRTFLKSFHLPGKTVTVFLDLYELCIGCIRCKAHFHVIVSVLISTFGIDFHRIVDLFPFPVFHKVDRLSINRRCKGMICMFKMFFTFLTELFSFFYHCSILLFSYKSLFSSCSFTS